MMCDFSIVFSFKGVILVQSILSVLLANALPPPHVVVRTLGVQVIEPSLNILTDKRLL
jgi:hypothetical protein